MSGIETRSELFVQLQTNDVIYSLSLRAYIVRIVSTYTFCSIKLGIHMPVACTLAYQLLASASYSHVYSLTGMPVTGS